VFDRCSTIVTPSISSAAAVESGGGAVEPVGTPRITLC
jgi:hypothetical protein